MPRLSFTRTARRRCSIASIRYENTTNASICYGEGTREEMCLFGMMRYPAGGLPICVL